MRTPDFAVGGGTRHPWVHHHAFVTFVALAYGISWSLWLIAALGGGQITFLLGALGPMAAAAAAAAVTVWSGGSLAGW